MGIRKARAIAVAIGLGLCFALVTAVPAMAAPGTVEGMVVEPEEGEGKAGFEVCAEPATPADPEGACVLSEDGSGSGPAGHYELALEPGNYKLRFQPPPESQYVFQYYWRKLRFAGAKTVEVESGGVHTLLDTVLDIGGRVAGKVTDTTGVALSQVEACVFSPLAPEFGTYCGETAPSGKWEVIGLPSATYVASFIPKAGSNFFPQFFDLVPTLAEAEEFLVVAGEETPGIDAKLEAGIEIQGTVTEAGTATPLAGVRVCALRPVTAAEVACVPSGFDGSYEIDGLHLGEYVVGFSVARSGVLSGEDAFVRQYYEDRATFAEADPVVANLPGIYQDVDAHLVRGPEVFPDRVSAPPRTSATAAIADAAPAKPAALRCRKHFRKKVVGGKSRCVRAQKRKQGKRHQGKRGGKRPAESR